MKIDTTDCSPIAGSPEEAIIRPNKYILPTRTDDDLTNDLHAGFFHSRTPTSKSSSYTSLPGAPKKSKKEELAPVVADDASDAGRQVMYLPTLVYTPVQTSLRQTQSDSPRSVTTSTSSAAPTNNSNSSDNSSIRTNHRGRRLLSAANVEELNFQLEHLFLGNNHKEEETKQEIMVDDVAATASKTFGRIETTAFSYKTCSNSQVVRSARFQK
ncbi:hypothetical protein IV203_014000 [Nitzschia inconspicua]|uniref:Uncharacterized protein n=1 Tax=Nitzschia inconspicua TaxID=303405 RepID=A0A9K3Q970_9STRA|nr:hypothetical protein IV203_014218 [Nitzschia inconspicua]KAG7374905.1 hypothetical protein IV203_014000 [Nitzschia inconspicua]